MCCTQISLEHFPLHFMLLYGISRVIDSLTPLNRAEPAYGEQPDPGAPPPSRYRATSAMSAAQQGRTADTLSTKPLTKVRNEGVKKQKEKALFLIPPPPHSPSLFAQAAAGSTHSTSLLSYSVPSSRQPECPRGTLTPNL